MKGRDIDELLKHYITGEDIEVHMLKDPKQQALYYQMERLSEQYAKKFFHLHNSNTLTLWFLATKIYFFLHITKFLSVILISLFMLGVLLFIIILFTYNLT